MPSNETHVQTSTTYRTAGDAALSETSTDLTLRLSSGKNPQPHPSSVVVPSPSSASSSEDLATSSNTTSIAGSLIEVCRYADYNMIHSHNSGQTAKSKQDEISSRITFINNN